MGDYDPWGHAEQIGVPVYRQELRTHPGLWLPDRRAIIIRSGMRGFEERSVLAHELVHAEWDEQCGSAKAERRANNIAAERLIDPRELAALKRMYDAPDESWCHTLGATPELVLAALRVA